MDPDTPLYETMWALAGIVKSGKALYIGLSNYNGETMKKAAEILDELHCPFIINQNRYSIFDRAVERGGILDEAISNKKGMIIYSPLAQGLLTERYLKGIPKDSRVKTDGRFLNEKSITAEMLEKIGKLNDIAKRRGQTLAQMALAWVYAQKGITSVLIGASKPQQILENIDMLKNTKFNKEEFEVIDKIVG
jgi:L-glyceraldehyde 3-phosphate reductase